MATRKQQTTNIQTIDNSILGEYAISDYSERVYSKVYYSIRSLCGLVAKRTLKETFSWDGFKERFSNDFGKVEEKRFSLDQLLEYANRKFGKTLEDLLTEHDISWQRRREYMERNQVDIQTEVVAESTNY
ncbi:hypothetical protein NIES4101_34800 [Calothrix sp. NIES-4101]|uniref:hypothetical protein n=1 Tax=Calothrix sp. UHCC 0171 TaxID=3110245 RepID=UPI000B5F7663|nr:hypothetical protein [Calothrix sp. UHCC 0171]MEA5574635.1 hypothetical protein [Calothrix sp. UHCC 0171]BAZ37557.1 hypothetical protein NIES4101_34800 [Calothrix sp. NIES-4101]